MGRKAKNSSKDVNHESRHRIHSVEKHYYSIWVDLELMAKLKIYAENHECAVSDLVVESMQKLVAGVKLTKAAKEWMAHRRSLAEKRKS